MSDLLTHAEYQALAADLNPPRSPFIDGKYHTGRGGVMTTTNPATGAVIADITTANGDDVDLAVQKAREAFDQGHWSKMDPDARKDVLIRLCKLMTRNRRELAIKWHAEAIDKIYDQTAPTGDDALSFIVREPIGVVAAVLPWNFPLLMLAWKIGPALAAGCSVIVKPAEQTGGIGGRGGRSTRRVSGAARGWSNGGRTFGHAYGH